MFIFYINPISKIFDLSIRVVGRAAASSHVTVPEKSGRFKRIKVLALDENFVCGGYTQI